MRNKRRKWVLHVIAFVLMVAMLIPMTAPVSVQAAEDLYLAYQTDEWGRAVTSLQKYERELYKVEEVFLNVGDKMDLCYINAPSGGKVQWSSNNSSVAAVDNKGVITAVSEGVAEVTLNYSKTSLFVFTQNMSATVKIYVGEKNWNINVGASAVSKLDTYELKIGNRLELDLFEKDTLERSSYAEQHWVSVDWKSSNESVAKSYGNRIVAEKAGSTVITVTITNNVLKTSIVKRITANVTKPAYENNATWDNMYYQMYGENYKRLFKTDALNCTADIELDIMDAAWKTWAEKTPTLGISGAAELVDVVNALEIAFEGIFKGKDYLVEKERQEAILHLIKEITVNDTVTHHYINNASGALEKAKDLFTELDNVTEFADAIKKIETAGLDIPEAEQKTLINYILNDAAGDIKKVLSEGVTISEYLALTICLYEMDCKVLDDLQKCSKPGEALYDDVEMIRKEKEKNPEKFFKEKYGTDAFVRVAVKVIVKLAGKEAMNLLSVTGDFIKMWIEIAGVNKLSDLTKATYLMAYSATASDKVTSLRNEIKENYDFYTDAELMEKIDEYETVYRLYLSIVDVTLHTVWEKLDLSYHGELYDDMHLVMNSYHYDTHIATAMAWYMNVNPTADEHESVKTNMGATMQPVITSTPSTTQAIITSAPSGSRADSSIQEKMDQLYALLGKKYFTVNQKACSTSRLSAHGCDNCNMRDIADTTWFTKLFGTINVDNFPEHDVNASRRDHTGQSCFGFACFAQWYLYADSNTDKVSAECITSAKFNKTNMEKYVQPGDVIRVNGHSVLVYSIEKNGLMVIDCNWNSGGQLNCLVQKHLLDYNNTNYAGYTAYINRVTGITEGKTSSVEELVLDGIQGVLDLSATNWSAYNVGLDVSMYADKAYTIYDGAELILLGKYRNSKGNTVYHVYSFDLEMECYISAKYVKVVDMTPTVLPVLTISPTPSPTVTPTPVVVPMATISPTPAPIVIPKVTISPTPTPTVTPTPTPTVTPTPTPTVTPTPTPTVTPAPEPENNKQYGSLDLSATSWKGYNVGLDKDMNADKAYTIRHGSEFEILGEYTNKKGNRVYHVYSYDLGMECYVSAKYVKVDSTETEVYGTLDLSATSWSAYNVGTNVDMYADKAYTIRHGAKLKILGEYTNSKGNKVYHVYSYDLDMNCYVTAKYVKID